MAAYLITFKPASENPERGWPEESLAALAEQVRAHGVAKEPWRFNRKTDVDVGERVFLVRQGRKGHAILGFGRVASDQHNDRMRDVEFEALVNPYSNTVFATADELHSIQGGKNYWRTQSSGVKLPDDVAAQLETLVVGRVPIAASENSEFASRDWTVDELRASVEAYVEMLRLHRSGKPFVKKRYYRELASRFGRTEKSYEYRAQNISHVLALQGREWLPGLVPAKNVGAKVISQIEMLLAEIEGVSNNGSAAFAAKVNAFRKSKSKRRPTGSDKPKSVTGTTTTYVRDPEVKAWVLELARGICEACNQPAPFLNQDGEPSRSASRTPVG